MRPSRRLDFGFFFWVLMVALIILFFSCRAEATEGTASYYTAKSCQREGTSGVWTASGMRYDENAMSCALPSYDFYGWYRVTNKANGRSVVVLHNDFGPNKKLVRSGRIIDLSKGAFKRIASTGNGLVEVEVERIR